MLLPEVVEPVSKAENLSVLLRPLRDYTLAGLRLNSRAELLIKL